MKLDCDIRRKDAYGATGLPLLDALVSADILIVEPIDGGFAIPEGCGWHFGAILTADELRDLGRELIALADHSG